MPVLTEDSGLVLLDLPPDHPDQPGIHVRRVAGHEMTDEEIIAWFADVAHRHGGSLRAAWMDAWCLMADEDHYQTYAENREHPSGWIFRLVDTPCSARHPGWPLDSLSVGFETGQYKAEMSIDDMDISFMREAADGFNAREKLQRWICDGIERMVL